MEGLALAGVTKLFSRIVDDLYDQGKKYLKREIGIEVIKSKIPTLIDNQLTHVRYVKTLWQVDRAVDIDEFYCDSHLIAPKTGKKPEERQVISKISDFNTNHNIVIRGIAGQGKSIFLRYLCIREFELGNKIPIFIELRRIQPSEKLFDHISRFFEVLDLPMDEQLFKYLAKDGYFVFFLDAFDEVDSSIVQKLINEIEYLTSIAPKCMFIISTRPANPIEMSASFDVWTLDNLRGDEYKTVINKLYESSESADVLVKRLALIENKINQLLCTPLLIMLLIISYKSYNAIPEQLSEFYESIFFCLLKRHDGTKPGFRRIRKLSINDSQYREIFNVVCFESRKKKSTRFDHDTLYEIVHKSLNIVNSNEDAEQYIDDIIHITCIIIHEGNEYKFIHKSIQEYYSASFIKSRSDEKAIDFYVKTMDRKMFRHWEPEILFLEEIDTFRYYKYQLIPLCLNVLGEQPNESLLKGLPPLTEKLTRGLFGEFNIEIELFGFGKYISWTTHCEFSGK